MQMSTLVSHKFANVVKRLEEVRVDSLLLTFADYGAVRSDVAWPELQQDAPAVRMDRTRRPKEATSGSEVVDPMRPKLDLDINDIRHRYLLGESPTSIAHTYGCSHKTICARLEEHGIALRNLAKAAQARRIKIDERELRAAYDAGVSVLAMARRFGLSRNVIDRRLREMGLPIRGGSEANLIRFAKASHSDRRALALAANKASRRHGQRSVPADEPRRLLGDHLGDRYFRAATSSSRCKELSQFVAYTHELPIVEMLADLHPKTQTAVGPYNLDISIGSVAVEVHAAGYVYEAHRRLATRTVQLIDSGWSVVVAWIVDGLPERDDLIAAIDLARRLESGDGQYWVVRRNAKTYTVARDDLNAFAIPPRPRD